MLTPTNKLEAVNTMLTAIGNSPVSSLESGLVEAELAETILNATSREVQSQGWHFNREFDFPLVPSFSGEIVLPSNCLKVDTMTQGTDLDLVQRGQRLYNRKEHTYKVGKTVNADIVLFLDFTELPEIARNYIVIKATRVFQDRVLGSDTLHGFQKQDEELARIAFMELEADTADYSIFDNSSVTRVLDRNIGATKGY